MRFHQFIQSCRLDRGWTQAELAVALGMSVQWVSKIELGKISPRVEQATEILRVMGYEFVIKNIESPKKKKNQINAAGLH